MRSREQMGMSPVGGCSSRSHRASETVCEPQHLRLPLEELHVPNMKPSQPGRGGPLQGVCALNLTEY